MSDRDDSPDESAYGEAEETDDEPPDAEADAAGDGEIKGEEPLDADGPGDPLSPTWAQPQRRYPAPERPPDRADALPRSAGEVAPADNRGDRPPAPDPTTGDEGGGTDAEFRDPQDREAGPPLRKSPARERRRAG